MTALLHRLYNLSDLQQQMMALAFTLMLAGGIGCLVFLSYANLQSSMQSLNEQQLLLTRLERTAALREQLSATENKREAGNGVFLQGSGEAVITANLQSLVSRFANAKGVNIASISTLPENQQAGVKLIGLKVVLNGTLKALHEVIFELETSAPPLLVSEFAVQSVRTHRKDVEPRLTVNLAIYGAIGPNVSDKEIGRQGQRK